MEHYIDKSALVAEVESKRKYAQTLGDNAINSSMQQFYDGMKPGCVNILSFIDTLEVKEVQEEPVSEDICNQCEAYNDKDKCDELVFGHNCPIVTTSEDFEKDVKLIINKL